ncbi:type IV pilin protein [Pseudomonas saudiphocaensis]|uniref:Tfp pilus assembly protein PilE-like protein n=1 Tax=Pseudomonas saudiphocaensis TaxID=1499686 RepID=A0A078LZH6_9PSED|nr:type IV pilin protein [Pseudomonas saudiphocaensis]CDZ95747.1 Tfp pilus assembly protein PilE-like protein [Pseudomonas saudiphocaensis]
MLNSPYRQKGFTLIELMITVVIIGILASIAYPSYQEFVKRGNRTEGQAFLNEVAARQERYYAQNNEYVTSDADIGKLNLKAGNNKSETGKYVLSLGSSASDGGYTLTATQQFGDSACGNLTLTATGVKGVTGSKSWEDCWK